MLIYAFIIHADTTGLVFALMYLANLPQHIEAAHEYERGYENDMCSMLPHEGQKRMLEEKELNIDTGITACKLKGLTIVISFLCCGLLWLL